MMNDDFRFHANLPNKYLPLIEEAIVEYEDGEDTFISIRFGSA